MLDEIPGVVVETLREYMERVESLMSADVPLWYRGTGRISHALRPSLFRHPTKAHSGELIELEQQILRRYKERSIPYQSTPWNRDRDQDWEMLFIMQHFSVPTRLLDWTESPYVGLYFALMSAPMDHKTGMSEESACVWVLQPESWNRKALADISYPGEILSIGGKGPLDSYSPSSDIQYMRLMPVAMHGLHNSPRIVAQRGAFTIFGKGTEAMESVAMQNDFGDGCLTKIEIPGKLIGDLRKALTRIGITDSVIYPDLEGLAREMKRYFGFPV